MAVKQADLGRLGIQAESSFLGSTTGSLFQAPGAVSLEWQTQYVKRTQRVSVWRQDAGQTQAGYSFKGSLEFELHASRALGAILDTFFTLKGVVADTGFNLYTYRPWRNDPPASSSVRIMAEFDSHWLMFSGVLFKRIRFTGRTGAIVRVSLDWISPRLTEYTTTPGWTFVEDSRKIMTGDAASADLDTVNHGQVSEFSVEFSDNIGLSNMGPDGEYTQATRFGQQNITGTLVEYFDSALDLPGGARGGTEFDLDLKMPAQGDATRYLNVEMPVILFRKADQTAIDQADSMINATFVGLQPSALDDTDELQLRYTVPT